MAITIRHSTNSALQYNEIDLTDYLVAVGSTGKKFLTKQPLQRILNATEASALSFIGDDDGLAGYSAMYRFYDASGAILNEEFISLTSCNIHNTLPVSTSVLYQPTGTIKLTVSIISKGNLFLNPDFESGSGNTFTNWTLTQPTRTNNFLRSNQFTTSPNSSGDATVTSSSELDPFGGSTGWVFTDSSVVDTRYFIGQTFSFTSGINNVISFYIKKINSTPTHYPVFDMSSSSGANIRAIVNPQTGAVNTALSTGAVTIVSTKAYEAENGYLRISVTFNFVAGSTLLLYMYPAGSANGTTLSASATGSTGYFGVQVESGTYASPYIPTTTVTVTTSVGEFLQDTTGGIKNSRCMKIWAETTTNSTFFRQSVSLTSGETYKIRFRAKLFDTATSGSIGIQIDAGGWDAPEGFLTSAWQWYEFDFTSGSTGSQNIDFKYTNAEHYGFAEVDDFQIFDSNYVLVTDEHSFVYDSNCYNATNEVHWINKLGAEESFVFTGLPIKGKSIERDNAIENPMNGNFISPKPIYQSRTITSREEITLFTRCENEETARWLRDELFDNIASFLRVGDEYYPIQPQATSVEIYNENGFNYQVAFKFKFAYDVNVQTI